MHVCSGDAFLGLRLAATAHTANLATAHPRSRTSQMSQHIAVTDMKLCLYLRVWVDSPEFFRVEDANRPGVCREAHGFSHALPLGTGSATCVESGAVARLGLLSGFSLGQSTPSLSSRQF